MSAISENIKYFRNKNSLTQAQLADKLNVSEQAVYNWEHGTRIPRMGYIEKMAELFNIESPDILKVNRQDTPTNIHKISGNIVKVPLIGTIAMGTPITADQNIEYYDAIELEYDIPADELFELQCKGHSMEPTIPDGAIGLFEMTSEVEDGEIAAVQVDHDEEATLKRIQHSKDQILLKPDNPAYPTLTIDKDHPGRIIGRLLEYKVKMHK